MPDVFGTELRRWRSRRHLSQLDLATLAGVSQRHISFLETGRSRPSREMIIHLAGTLDVPLRARNELLGAAGFAPAYSERRLFDPELDGIRRVLETVLRAQEPHPAYVVDRHWNLSMSNDAAGSLIAAVAPPGFDPAVVAGNTMRLLLHPAGLRDAVLNWPDAARVLVARLRREALETPDDAVLRELVEEAEELVAAVVAGPPAPAAVGDLLVPIVLRTDAGALRLFTTIATIGAPHDVTLEELRLEMLLPADDEAGAHLRSIVQTG